MTPANGGLENSLPRNSLPRKCADNQEQFPAGGCADCIIIGALVVALLPASLHIHHILALCNGVHDRGSANYGRGRGSFSGQSYPGGAMNQQLPFQVFH